MKNYQLKDIADIRSGYSFRSKLEPDKDGNVLVVQLKELSAKNTVDLSTAVKILFPDVSENYRLHKDDLVFRSRGSDATAAIMDADFDNVILSSPFQRIRIKKDMPVIPEFLLWYINSKESQSYFETNKVGTSISMISTTVLAELPVTIPPLELQQKIIEVNSLASREIELQEELIRKKKILTETVLLKSIEKYMSC